MILWRPPRTTTKQRYPFHHRGLEYKSRKSRDIWSNRQVWPWRTKWSRAKANRILPREAFLIPSSSSQTPAGCPVIQLNSDTIYSEIESDSTVPPRYTAAASSGCYMCFWFWLNTNQMFPWVSLWVWVIARTAHRTQGNLFTHEITDELCCCLVAKSCPTLLLPHGL